MGRVTIEEALSHILDDVVPLASERVPLPIAPGRVLCEAVVADRDQPPFNRAMMDGFALRSHDVAEVPVTLSVVGEVAAGAMSAAVLEAGQAIRIMTGAPVPAGADAVQMLENTVDGGDTVTIKQSVPAGRHIAPRGQEMTEGAVAVDAGQVLTTARLGLAWSLGAAEVEVYREPRVSVMTTGDELVELHDTPGLAQIRDSNRATLGDLAIRAGAAVVGNDLVPDDPDEIRQAIRRAGKGVDVLVLSGGVSAGAYDFVADCLKDEGVQQIFHKVHVKPGKPVWYGRRGTLHVLGLPGNPVSSYVTARLFLLPLIRKLAGRTRIHDPRLSLPLLEAFRGTGSRPTFQPAVVEWGQGVRLVQTHGSGDLNHFSNGTALAYLPADHADFNAGDRVEVMINEESLLD
jgi:molybdopterin molybdotransferase